MTRIGLLLAGHVDPRSVHVAGDYPELFTKLFGGHDIDLVRYDIDRGALPDRVDECDGWICSPSRASVYDNESWIADAEALHRDIVAREVPYVGICFGHQLLAQALGGRVARADGGWGIGVQSYAVVEPQSWMSPAASQFSLLASHQDQVVVAPPQARVIASAPYCPIAGLAVGERAWSIQAHPEFVAPLADHLLNLRIELIGAARVDAARQSLDRPTDQALVGTWISTFFASQFHNSAGATSFQTRR